jgi:hypothetical protein
MMKMKGMRDIPTQYGLAKRSKPNSRDEAITELARLEHEKARLEREMALWQENQARTQKRLSAVTDRLSMLQGIVENRPPEAQPLNAGAQEATVQSSEQRWSTVSLEY